jgi:PAS domain S-box-containing protein
MVPDTSPNSDQKRITELEEKLARLQQQEQLRHRIMTGAATHSGQDYFERMALELAEILSADFTLIGNLADDNYTRIKTLALCADNQLVDNIEYNLPGTPCADVLNESVCSHPTQVTAKFPDDQLLIDMGIEGYVGVPLYESEHKPLGIIAALYRQPVADPLLAETTLQLFANLTAAEILRQREIDKRNRLEQAHRSVSERLLEKGSELSESLRTLDAIIETLPSPIFFKNKNGIYRGCNQAFCDYLGKTREQIIGHTVYDVAPSKLANVYHRADLELMQHHGSQTYQAQVRFADGSNRDILFNKATIGDPGSDIIGLVGVMTDITTIRNTEREMSNLRNLLRNIIDSMPSALITIDEQARVSHWNQQASKLTGLSTEEAIGQDIHAALKLLPPDSDLIDQALISRKTRKIERTLRSGRGKEQYFEIMIYPLVADEMSGAALRIDNVTERVRLDEIMVQSEKMMSLGGLAGGMAHELNNPLAGILQNLHVINNRLQIDKPANHQLATEIGIDQEKINRYLQQRKIPDMLESIADAGQRAAAIVQNMLSFSRKEALELLPCNLKQIINQTLELLKNDLTSGYNINKYQINTELPDNLPPVMGVKSQLQQVFFNLLRSSAQAIQDWCEFNNEPKIQIVATANTKNVTIIFSDNGPGIEEHLRNRIFEPFFTTKDTKSGTGLGLSVSYFIITDVHNGSISVDSAPGHGASFKIEIPICQQESM